MANRTRQPERDQCSQLKSDSGRTFNKTSKSKSGYNSGQNQRKPLANVPESGNIRHYLRPIKAPSFDSNESQLNKFDVQDSSRTYATTETANTAACKNGVSNGSSKLADASNKSNMFTEVQSNSLTALSKTTSASVAPFEIFCDADVVEIPDKGAAKPYKNQKREKKQKEKLAKDSPNDSISLSEEVFSLLTQVQRGPSSILYKQTSIERKILIEQPLQPQHRKPLAPLDDLGHPAIKPHCDDLRINARDLFSVPDDENSPVLGRSRQFRTIRKILRSTTPSSAASPSTGLTPSPYVDCYSSKNSAYFDKKVQHLNLILAPPEYQREIYDYAREQEVKPRLKPKKRYMEKQPHLTSDMRAILVDWMIDVAVEYHLEDETLQLAVNYVDRFLSLMVVDKEKLQLVGTTAMLIASKYEEIYPPDLQQFVFVTDDSYTIKQVLKMERYLLNTLRFELTAPTINFFLCYFIRVCRSNQRCIFLAKYLSELALLDVEFVRFRPSLIASAVICVANLTTESVPWPVDLELSSQYSVADIYDCMTMILKSFRAAPHPNLKAVYDKYADNRYCQVALLSPPLSLPSLD